MTDFTIIATVLSMILGLSVTRLLLALVTVFRIRTSCRVDWVPLAWSGVLFAMQMEFWWAINQLPSLKPSFGFQEFLLLVLLTLMLFLAAALLLPSRAEDEEGGLRAYFEQDGRFALLALSAFLTLGAIINVSMFGADLNSGWAWLDLLMILVPVAAYLARSRRVYASLTGLYVPLAAVDTWVSIAT